MSNSHSNPRPAPLPTFEETYTLGPVLAKSKTCTIYLCTEKSPPYGRYACKSIVMSSGSNAVEDAAALENAPMEIMIMHHLSDCPGVVRIKESFHEVNGVHIVMELCEGGDLFDRVKDSRCGEMMAAKIMRAIIKVVMDCHSLGVLHRDLKPENFLFVREGADSELKVADMGASTFFEPGEIFSDLAGTAFYVAPEVLKESYGPEADLWSAGVILYVLLSGYPPFRGGRKDGILNRVSEGKLDFKTKPWPSISDSAKDLVCKMLNKNAEERITAHQVLCHEWMAINGIAPEGPPESAVLTRLRNFSRMNILKKMAIRYTAERLPEEETTGLREMFKVMDIDESGEITFDNLKDGLNRLGSEAEDTEIKALMDAADTDNSGTIDSKEFVTAMFHTNKMQKEANMMAAFEHFDKTGRGYITVNEIREGCSEFGYKDDNLKDAVREIDQNKDGKIDYDEFVAMMRGESNADQTVASKCCYM